MKTYLIIILKLFFVLSFCSIEVACNFFSDDVISVKLDTNLKNMDEIKQPENKNRMWNILIYMAADNNLESAAIEDLFEMELSKLNTDIVSVFILFDRSESYDTSNGNWSGTRLYKLKTGRNKECNNIISEEIPCEELGLIKESDNEIDMSSSYTLKKTLSYIIKKYPANHYGFIMWGHGTGWRSNYADEHNFKGFAYDDSTGSYMTLKQLGNALRASINNYKLDFVGLDTCFSGELEVMYELKDICNFAVGTEGLMLLSGWNYENIFNNFEISKSKTAREFINIAVSEFRDSYSKSNGASIVGVDMSKINEYFKQFDLTCGEIAKNITNRQIRDSVSQKLFNSSSTATNIYSYGASDSDVYMDINSMLLNLSLLFNNNIINEYMRKFNDIKKSCIFSSWASNNLEAGLGVYYGTLTAGKIIGNVHGDFYIKDKTNEQICFVQDSNGYVPNIYNGESLLNKIFYKEY